MQGSKNRTARMGKPESDRQNKTARTELPEQDYQHRAVKIRQLGLDKRRGQQNKQPEQDC
jgi:hypothetical protein